MLQANAPAVLGALATVHQALDDALAAPVPMSAAELDRSGAAGGVRASRGVRRPPHLRAARLGAAARDLSSTAGSLQSRCEALLGNIDAIEQVTDALNVLNLLLAGLTLIPPAAPATATLLGVTTFLGETLDAVSLVAKFLPFVPVPASARFSASPSVLRAGDGGTLWGRVKMESVGYSAADFAGFAGDAADLFPASKLTALEAKFGSILGKIDAFEARFAKTSGFVSFLADHWPGINTLLTKLQDAGVRLRGLQGTLTWFNDTYYGRYSAGDLDLSLAGLSGVTPSAAWSLTSAPDVLTAFMVDPHAPAQTVTLSPGGPASSHAECVISPAPPSPALGDNTFRIGSKVGPSLAFLAALDPSPTLHQGESLQIDIPVVNTGDSLADGLDARIAVPGKNGEAAAWTNFPSGITGDPVLYARYGDELDPGDTGFVEVTVTVATGGAVGPFTFPVTVARNGKVVAQTTVQVQVLSQLADLTVNAADAQVLFYDSGVEDNDSITVELNGAPVVTRFRLSNAGETFGVHYLRGRNVMRVYALNEGDLSPNTAALVFDHTVPYGTETRDYGLSTGEVVTLVIDYDPSLASAAPAATLRPGRLDAARERSTGALRGRLRRLQRSSPPRRR